MLYSILRTRQSVCSTALEHMLIPSLSYGGVRYVLLDLEVRYQLIHANPMLRLRLQTLWFGHASSNYHAILVPHGADFCPAPRPGF